MAEEKKEKDYSDENQKRLLIALAILLGFTDENNIEKMNDLTADQKYIIRKEYEKRNLDELAKTKERLAERDIQIQMAEKGIDDGIKIFQIVGVKDDRTCDECRRWQGTELTLEKTNLGLPTVEEFINNHGFHPNCRCSLQEKISFRTYNNIPEVKEQFKTFFKII